MKRFRFPFDRLLSLRVRAEEGAAQSLAAARAAEETAREALAVSTRRRDEMRRLREQITPEASLAGTLLNIERAIQRAEEQRARAEQAQREALAHVTQAQERYAARRADRRALEQLRERRHDAWTTDIQRAEQADLDEISSARFPSNAGSKS